MKPTFVFLLCCLAGAAAAAQPAAPEPGMRTVYLLPMGHGFDQYLANHLAGTGVLDVVTDPQLADAVLTDHIGPSFENRMKQLYPVPEPKPAEKDETATAAGDAPAGSAKAPPVGMMSVFARGKGNIFLVDTNSSQVLWSTYEKPAGVDTAELDRSAARVVERLKKHMAVKPPKAGKKSKSAQAAPEAQPAPAPPEEKK